MLARVPDQLQFVLAQLDSLSLSLLYSELQEAASLLFAALQGLFPSVVSWYPHPGNWMVFVRRE